MFGEVSIDVESRRVRAPTGSSSLEPRVFDLLQTLIERPGLTASRDYLIEAVWGDEDGSDEALSQAVTKLRRALGDDARAPRFIETVPKLGYRWIFQEGAADPNPPSLQWARGPSWVVAGFALIILVAGGGGLGVYAWSQTVEPHEFEIRKVRLQRTADGRCVKQVQLIRGKGVPTAAERAPPEPSSPGCEPPPIPREFTPR